MRHPDWRAWARQQLGPDPALLAERDALARERDDLLVQLQRAQQRATDLRAARRLAVREAFEPVQVGDCTKLRYLREEDAHEHAIQIAQRTWGEHFNAYQCRRCPAYPGFGTRPWHVGHCRPDDPGAVCVERGVLRYSCGCASKVGQGRAKGWREVEQLWTCAQHPAESVPS